MSAINRIFWQKV